jgi:PKD domain
MEEAGATVKGECEFRGRAGETPQVSGCSGLPVLTAVEEAEIGPFGYLTLPRSKGTTAYLSAEELENPSSVFEGSLPPLFFVAERATRFYRPPRKEDANDVNAEDNIATVAGEGLVVGVHDGNVLEVEATASPSSTTAGSPVEFTAAASGGEPGETFTYDWTFGDGTTATTVGSETVSHPFVGSGTYVVRATAHGSAGSGGESGPVEVVVGNPPPAEAPGATTTPRPKRKPTGAPGKGREGRGGKGSKPAPSGGHKKKQKRKDNSAARRSKSPAGRSRSDVSPQPSTPVPSPILPPEPAAAVPPPRPVEPFGGASPEPPGCCSGEAPPEGSPQHGPSPSPPTAQGQLVEGRLVGDDLGPTTLEEAVGGSTEGEGSRSAPGAVGKGGVGVPAGVLIVVALLAGGALFEWRRSRPTS